MRKGRDLLSFWSAGVCLPGLVGAWGGNLNQHGGRIIIDQGQGGGDALPITSAREKKSKLRQTNKT